MSTVVVSFSKTGHGEYCNFVNPKQYAVLINGVVAVGASGRKRLFATRLAAEQAASVITRELFPPDRGICVERVVTDPVELRKIGPAHPDYRR